MKTSKRSKRLGTKLQEMKNKESRSEWTNGKGRRNERKNWRMI